MSPKHHHPPPRRYPALHFFQSLHVHNSVSEEDLVLLDVLICMDLKKGRGGIYDIDDWMRPWRRAGKASSLIGYEGEEVERRRIRRRELWFTTLATLDEEHCRMISFKWSDLWRYGGKLCRSMLLNKYEQVWWMPVESPGDGPTQPR